jgi:hypothetical protein
MERPIWPLILTTKNEGEFPIFTIEQLLAAP